MAYERHNGELKDEVNRVVGERLRARRLAAGLTLRALEIKSGVSNGFISLLESGFNSPSAANLLALARALGCTPNWFYGPLLREGSNVGTPGTRPDAE